MFFKCIFEVTEMLLVVMGGHLQRGGACIVFTVGKSGFIVITWQTVVHFLLGPVPQVNVTDDAMWLWRGLVLPSLEFNIRIREFNLIWEAAKHAETRSKGHLLSCHTCKNHTMRCRAQSATQSSISMVPLVSVDCLTAICHSRKQRIP